MTSIFDLVKPEAGVCLPSVLRGGVSENTNGAQDLVIALLKQQIQILQDELRLLKQHEGSFDPGSRVTHLWCRFEGAYLCGVEEVDDSFVFEAHHLEFIMNSGSEYIERRVLCPDCLPLCASAVKAYEAACEAERSKPENIARREKATAKLRATYAKRRACLHKNTTFYPQTVGSGDTTICDDCGKRLTKQR